MNKIMRMQDKENLPIILFIIILINFLPLFVLNAFTKKSIAVPTSIMGIPFVLSVCLLILMLIKTIKFDKKQIINVIILTSLIVIMYIVQIINYVKKEFFIMDLINIAAIFINIFLLFICLMNIEVEEKGIIKFFKAIVYLGLISIVWNIILYFFEILNETGIRFENFEYARYVKSFFSNRNTYAFFLVVVLIANSFLINFEKNNKLYKISLLLIWFAIWSTYSKTGYILAVVFLELFFIFCTGYKIKKKIIICTIIAILTVFGGLNILNKLKVYNFFMVDGFSSTSSSSSSKQLESLKKVSGRTDIWKAGIKILNSEPTNYLFGVGRFNSTNNLKFKDQTFTQFHNIYLDIMLTGGIIELIYVISIFILIIRQIIKSNLNRYVKKTYYIMYFIYSIYIMIESGGRLSIGGVDTLCMIFFISIPLLHANSIKNKGEKDDNT